MTGHATLPHCLLLPGNMCDARLWQGDASIITGTIRDHGLGQSFIDFEDDESITLMAQRALASHSGPLLPIGFSMGGIVALDMVRLAPERIVGLGLIDTTAGPDTRGDERLRQQSDVLAGDLERVVVDELKPNYLAACHSGNTELLALLRDMALGLGPEVFVRQSEALRTRIDLAAVLPTITVPTFVACGAEDGLCSPEAHQVMATQIRQSTFATVPNAGHLLPLEQPTALADIIANFLSTLVGSPYD